MESPVVGDPLLDRDRRRGVRVVWPWLEHVLSRGARPFAQRRTSVLWAGRGHVHSDRHRATQCTTDVDETGRHSRLEFVFRRRPTCDDIDLDALHTIAEPEDRTTYSVRDSVLR